MDDSAGGDMFYERMRDTFTADALRQEVYELRFAVLPGREVKVGDTWTREHRARNPRLGDVIYKYDCKFERVEEKDGRRLAVVTYTGKLEEAPGNTPPPNPMGLKQSLKSWTFRGSASVDVKSAQPIAGSEESTSQIELTAAARTSSR